MIDVYDFSKLDNLMIKIANVCTNSSENKKIMVGTTGEFLEQCVMVDSFKETYCLGRVISINELEKFQFALKRISGGKNIIYDKYGLTIKVSLGFSKRDSAFLLYFYIHFNGPRCLNSLFIESPKPKNCGLDGNDNVLVDRALHWSGRDLSCFFGDTILPEIENKCVETVKYLYLNMKLEESAHPIYLSSKIQHLEFYLDFETQSYSSKDFARIFEAVHAKFPVASITGERSVPVPKGAKFEIAPGMYFVIYFKKENILRIELKVLKDYFKKAPLIERNLTHHLFINEKRKQAINLFSNILMDTQSYKSLLTACEALLELRSIIKEKHFISLLRKIREGDGKIIVKSTNQAEYREVRRLMRLGVFLVWPKQSTYYLNKRYHEIIKLDGITYRCLLN